MILDGRTVLVTGGTGSFGRAFVKTVLRGRPRKIIVFSRDEFKQHEMRNEVSDHRLEFFIGDVRDRQRLSRAFDGVDVVVHAAALKQIPVCEYNPFEAIATNVIGARNVMDEAIDRKVWRVIAISTDKAVEPANVYGKTKGLSEALFVSGNSYTGRKPTKFSVVRYGNVVNSRGSVIPFFMRLKRQGEKTFPITDLKMTRFWITLDQAVDLVLYAIQTMQGGEIFVPKIPSMRVVDLAKAIEPDCEFKEIGRRKGEKLHEIMVSEVEAEDTRSYEGHYIIQPAFHWWRMDDGNGGEKVPTDFRYSSDRNDKWLDVDDLRRMLRIEEN